MTQLSSVIQVATPFHLAPEILSPWFIAKPTDDSLCVFENRSDGPVTQDRAPGLRTPSYPSSLDGATMMLLHKGMDESTNPLEKACEEQLAKHMRHQRGSEVMGTSPNAQMAVEETTYWIKQFTHHR